MVNLKKNNWFNMLNRVQFNALNQRCQSKRVLENEAIFRYYRMNPNSKPLLF